MPHLYYNKSIRYRGKSYRIKQRRDKHRDGEQRTFYIYDGEDRLGRIVTVSQYSTIWVWRDGAERRIKINMKHFGMQKQEVIRQYMYWLIDPYYKVADISRPPVLRPGRWISDVVPREDVKK